MQKRAARYRAMAISMSVCFSFSDAVVGEVREADHRSGVELPSSLIAKLEWRQPVSPSIGEELTRLMTRERLLETGHELRAVNWRSGNCLLLVDGLAARYKLMPNGRRQITALHIPGDFVDLGDLLIGQPDYDVVALDTCRFAVADQDQFLALAEASPAAIRLLWMDSLLDAAIQQEWLVSMGRRSALGHLAHIICELFLRLKIVGRTEDFCFRLPLTQADIADVLGLSMVHVNRMLKELRNDAVMTWANHLVTIGDWRRLTDIAEFDPAYLAFRKPVF